MYIYGKIPSTANKTGAAQVARKGEKTMYYNYLEAVKEDVKEYIKDNVNLEEYRGNRDGLEEELNDTLWIDDSVTGNASGSYTFSRCRAAEYVMADSDTVSEALREFCIEAETIADKFLSQDWEYFDVTARCYVLCQAIGEALDELEEAGVFEELEEQEEQEETAGALDRIAAAMKEGFQDIADRAGAAAADPQPVAQ